MSHIWDHTAVVLDALWSVMATGLIHGTVLAALTALACATLLRRASPALLASLWTIVLLKFLIPLGPELPVSLSGLVDALLHGSDQAAPSAGVMAAAATGHAGGPSLGAALWLGAQAALWLGYAGVVLWLLGRRISGQRALRRWAAAGAAGDENVLAAVARTAQRLGLARVPAVRVHQDLASPQIVGLWRPILVLPAWLPARRDRLAAALMHELAHLRRRDTWVRGVQLLVGTLLCFWPVVNWVNRRIDMYREMACDQWAIACGPLSARDYARMLVAFARRQAVPATAASMGLLGGRKQLEQRVDALLCGPSRPHLTRISAAVVLLWALLSLGSTRGARAAGHAPECVITADMVAHLFQRFPEADRDGDGVLTAEEACAHWERIQRVLDNSDAGGVVDDPAPAEARADSNGLEAVELAAFKAHWDAVGWPDCAACNCGAVPGQNAMSSLAFSESKICTNEGE